MTNLITRLNKFNETWHSNPAAKLDFARLVRDVLDQPQFDHADAPLRDWIDEELATAKRLGIR